MILTPVGFSFFPLWKAIYMKMTFLRVNSKYPYHWASQIPSWCMCVGVFLESEFFTCWLFEKYFLASLTVRHTNNLRNQRFSSSFHWNCIFPSSGIFMGSCFPWRSIMPNFLVFFHPSHIFFLFMYFSHYINSYQGSHIIFKIIFLVSRFLLLEAV